MRWMAAAAIGAALAACGKGGDSKFPVYSKTIKSIMENDKPLLTDALIEKYLACAVELRTTFPDYTKQQKDASGKPVQAVKVYAEQHATVEKWSREHGFASWDELLAVHGRIAACVMIVAGDVELQEKKRKLRDELDDPNTTEKRRNSIRQELKDADELGKMASAIPFKPSDDDVKRVRRYYDRFKTVSAELKAKGLDW